MFTYPCKVRMHHTDAAGILYFASLFHLISDATEECFQESGYSFRSLISGLPFTFALVHAEADYHLPLTVSDALEISVEVQSIGNSSFALAFAIHKVEGEEKVLAGTAKTVHVVLNPETRGKTEIPKTVRSSLEKHISLKRREEEHEHL